MNKWKQNLEVKDIINDYTIEDCERDLEFLVDNNSLTKLQDTKNISTLKEFKVQELENKNNIESIKKTIEKDIGIN